MKSGPVPDFSRAREELNVRKGGMVLKTLVETTLVNNCEDTTDHRSYTHNLSSCEIKT